MVFKKSLKTKDRRVALALKDEFLKEVGFFEEHEDRERARVEKAMTPADHYFETLSSLDGDDATLSMLADELGGQLQDPNLSMQSRNKLSAQRQAVWRLYIEGRESEEPHPYSLTLSEAISRYISEMAKTGKAPKTIDKVRTAHKRYRAFLGTDRQLPNITKPMVLRYWRKLRDEDHLAKGTVSTDLGFLGAAFALAQDEGFVAASTPNPFRDQRLGGFPDAGSRQVFSDDQLQAVMREVKRHSDTELLSSIVVGYYSGMRISEIFGARLGEQEGIFGWDVAKGKTRAAKRFVPIQSPQKETLQALGFWPDVGKSLPFKTKSADALGKRFGRHKKTALKDLSVADEKALVFHSLRHGFITTLYSASYNQLEITDLVGHEKSSQPTETARTYSHGQTLLKLVAMTNAIPNLAIP